MKTLVAAIMTSVMALAIASPVRAGVAINDVITLANSFGHPAGSFIVHDLTNPLVPDFKTYCAELEEIAFFGTPYKVVGLGSVTIAGGKTLTPFAAWLYDRSLGHSGGLPNFNPTDNVDNNIVQFGIWKSMGYTPTEIGQYLFYPNYDSFLAAKGWLTLFNSQNAAHQLAGTGNVRVMNLKFNTTNVQDQLVEVPEPLSCVIWPLIFGCVGGGWTLLFSSPIVNCSR